MDQTHGHNLGKRIILPASFIGGPRDMRKRYIHAIILVQRFSEPDIFLTMTYNPNWLKIKKELLVRKELQDRLDLVTRVFHAKLEQLINELFKKEIFGAIAAFVCVVEFQKRGLSHAHFVIILKHSHKLTSLEQYDDIVCAKLPNLEENVHIYNAIIRHMMRGPC